MKKLQFRIILAIGFLLTVYATAMHYRAHVNETKHVDHLFNQQLDMALNFDQSIREYMADKIRPLMYEVLPEGEFIPYAMSTSYASREIFKSVQEKFSDVSIKFSSDNPRNPANQAGPDEEELIKYFNQNPRADALARNITINGIEYLARVTPMRTEESCLRCHGDPAGAPRKLIEIYGSEKGFHRRIGSVMGLDTVAIPLSVYHTSLSKENRHAYSAVFIGIAGLFLAIVFVMRFMMSDQRLMAEELNRSEGKYRTILETIEDGYYEVDLSGNLGFFNDSLCRIIGYSRTELTGMNNRTFMSDETSRDVYQLFNQVFTTGEPAKGLDVAVIHKDGTKRHINISITLMRKKNGKPAGFRGIARDVTEKRLAEKELAASEEKFRLLAETNIDAIYQINKNGTITYASHSAEGITGFKADEQIGTHYTKYIPKSHLPMAMELFQKVISGNTIKSQEIVSNRKDGQELHSEISFAPLWQNNQIVGIQGTMRDITERVKSQNALKVSEERYRLIFLNSPIGITHYDQNGIVTGLNPKAMEILRIKSEQGLGFNLLHQQNEGVFKAVSASLSGKNGYYEGEFTSSLSGRNFFMRSHFNPILSQQNQVIGGVCMMEDVTQEHKAREALEESEEKFRLLAESSSDGIFQMDLNGIFTYVSPSFAETYQYSADEIVGTNYLHFIVEHQHTEVQELFDKLLAKEKIKSQDSAIIRKDCREVEINVSSAPIIKDGRVIGIQGVMRDITEQKKAERALQESEEKYRLIFNSAPVGITQFDNNSVVTAINPKALWMVGLSEQEVLGFNFFEKVKNDRMLTSVKMALDGSTGGFQGEYRSTISGNMLYLDLFTAPIVTADNRINGGIMMIKDITEQIIAQLELRESEAKYRLMFNTVPVGIFHYDHNGVITQCNQKFEHITGVPHDQLIGYNMLENFKNEKLLNALKESLSGKPGLFEGKHTSDISGKETITRGHFVPVFDERHSMTGGVCMVEDISDAFKAQHALRESRKSLETVFDAITESVLLVDPEGVILALNKTAALRLRGVADQMVGKNAFDFLPEDVAKFRKEKLTEVIRSGKPFDFEDIRYGRHVWTNYYPIFDDKGQVNRIAVFTLDVHDRKTAEHELAKFKKISDLANYGTGIFAMDGRIVYVNQTFANQHGYDLDELADQYLTVFHTEDQMIFVKDLRKRLFKENGFVGEEVWHKRKDGSIFPMLMNAFVMENEAGEAPLLTVTAINISEMKRAQEALRESEEKYRTIFDSSPAALFYYNSDGVITDCNSSAAQITGGTKEDFIGFNMFERSYHQEILACMKRSLNGEPARFEGSFTYGHDRRVFHVKADYVPIYSKGKVVGGLCVGEDITNEIMAEKALKESEEKYRLIFDSSPLGIFHYDTSGIITECNPKTSEIAGAEPKAIIGFNLINGLRNVEFLNAIRKSLDGTPSVLEGKYLSITGGKKSYVRAHYVPIRVHDNVVGGICVAEDIAQRIRAEKQLRDSHEKLRQLTRYLQSARENERASIARDLHDELGQALTAINMEAVWVAKKIPEDLITLRPRAEAISDLVVGAIGSVRRIISELRPTLLTDLGLAAAIIWQAHEYQKRIGITFAVAIDPEEFDVDEDLGFAIFRIFQEGTTNIIRHSRATQVEIRLEKSDAGIMLEIRDNGIGITEKKLSENESFGILGMRERAEVFGGTIEIASEPGKGTTLKVNFPV